MGVCMNRQQEQIDNIENMIHEIKEKDLPELKQQVAITNGKVKFHSKLLWAVFGGLGPVFLFLIMFYVENVRG